MCGNIDCLKAIYICLAFSTSVGGFSPCSEEARRVGVVCKILHVTQPEVGINISLSDETDIIEISVFC